MTTWSFPSVRRDGITLIAGLGETGVAAMRWCAANGAVLRVADTRREPPGLDAVRDAAAASDIDVRLGAASFDISVLDGVHTLVISPGLSPQDDTVASLLKAAHDLGIDVIGEVELFVRALRDLAGQGYQPKVVAVTGTNGKTTVTRMVCQLAVAAGYNAVAAGNISPAALTALTTALEGARMPDLWVLELSSFQLETTRSLHADAAAILNIAPDHIDWHGSREAYIAAKAALLRQTRVAVLNRDDGVVCGLAQEQHDLKLYTFGSDRPVYCGDLGLDDSQGMTWLCAARAASQDAASPQAPRTRKHAAPHASPRAKGELQHLMPMDALRVRGRHNALNALAALALLRSLGAGWAELLHGVRDYGGEPHRTEFVRAIGGVDFVNDSKGTNVSATVAALQAYEGSVLLIAGGLAKGQDFSALAQAARQHARAVLLMGQDADVIAAALDELGVKWEKSLSLDAAVRRAFARAQAGDTVLLSPACASMDMFRNYIHRGECFVRAVQELALDQGEVA